MGYLSLRVARRFRSPLDRGRSLTGTRWTRTVRVRSALWGWMVLPRRGCACLRATV